MERYGLWALHFSKICDNELESYVAEVSKDFRFHGEQMLKGLDVKRMRFRDSIHRVDQEGVKQRK